METKSQVSQLTRSRPRSVTILALLHILQGLSLLGYGLYLILTFGWSLGAISALSRYMPFASFEGAASGVVLTFFGLLAMLVALALLRLRSWAWMAAISFQGLGLLAALIDYFRQRPNYVGMIFGIILVLYLNQQEIQAAFRARGGAG